MLRPGGELRFYEHVVGTSWPLKAFQVAIEKTFWPRVGGNCHPARDTGHTLNATLARLADAARERSSVDNASHEPRITSCWWA